MGRGTSQQLRVRQAANTAAQKTEHDWLVTRRMGYKVAMLTGVWVT